MIFFNSRSIKQLVAILAILTLVNILVPHGVLAEEVLKYENSEALGDFRLVELRNFSSQSAPKYEIARNFYVATTAYTSEVWQTDQTPFTTSNGTKVRDGIVAANFLRYGTKVRFPEYFGDMIFEVQDRMNPRYWYRVDIWMKDKAEAKQFGHRTLKIEVLEGIKDFDLGQSGGQE